MFFQLQHNIAEKEEMSLQLQQVIIRKRHFALHPSIALLIFHAPIIKKEISSLYKANADKKISCIAPTLAEKAFDFLQVNADKHLHCIKPMLAKKKVVFGISI